MCCGDSKLIKCSLTFFFLFFLLCGLGLLAVGIWVIEDFRFVAAAVTYPTAFFQHAAYIAIATGSCAIVAFTIGCYGAWTESKAVLTVFSATAVVILLVESASIVLAFVFGAHSGPLLAHGAASTLKYDYGTANSDGVAATSAWDYAQITFRCCGYNNGSDYQGSTYDASNSQPNPWPLSCCETTPEGTFADVSSCTNDAEPRGSYAGVGCAAAIEGHVRDYGVVIGAVAAGVVFIQLMTVVFACTLAGRRVSSPDVI